MQFGERVGRYVLYDASVKGKGRRVLLHLYIDMLVEAKGGGHKSSSCHFINF